jgi:hypothetical protein
MGHATVLDLDTASGASPIDRLRCRLFGHRVHNREFFESGHRCTRCQEPILDRAGLTRVGHTLACFLRVHSYDLLEERDGHREYVCVRCGHPLLFRADQDPDNAGPFTKKVRYLCSLFGHDVHHVARRAGLEEYACGCGHSFLKSQGELAHIRHPLVCFFQGHRIEWIASRGMLDEYVCRDCGHPFCFTDRAESVPS